MASVVYLDTHVVAWLYASGGESMSERATRAIEETSELRISPMVRLELQYLYEIGRTKQPAITVIDALQSLLGLVVCDAPFAAVVHEAAKQSWTRDPFDRIIVAQAALNDGVLLTKDDHIRSNFDRSLW